MFDDPTTGIMVAIVVGALLLCLVPVWAFLARSYRSVPPGRALLLTGTAGTRVIRDGGALVLPIVHRADTLDLSVRTVTIQSVGPDGLSCRDGIRADCEAVFHVRINAVTEDILQVAASVGADRASEPETLDALFGAKFAGALKSVASSLEFDDLMADRERFRDEVLQVVGQDLNGYVLDDLCIDRLTQTPLSELDPNNVKDAEGIRRVTERVQQERVKAARIKVETDREVMRIELAAVEAVAAFDAERARAEAGAKAEIQRVQLDAELALDALAVTEAAPSQVAADGGDTGDAEPAVETEGSLKPWRMDP